MNIHLVHTTIINHGLTVRLSIAPAHSLWTTIASKTVDRAKRLFEQLPQRDASSYLPESQAARLELFVSGRQEEMGDADDSRSTWARVQEKDTRRTGWRAFESSCCSEIERTSQFRSHVGRSVTKSLRMLPVHSKYLCSITKHISFNYLVNIFNECW